MDDKVNKKMWEENTSGDPVKPTDRLKEAKSLFRKEKSCTKMLPYVSPRVVVRIPDIHGGLNQTVVSISDSDPCSPCDMTFKDISKTLCSPRTALPDSVTKTHIKPCAAVRKVDVINQSFEAYGKQLAPLEKSANETTDVISNSESHDLVTLDRKEKTTNKSNMIDIIHRESQTQLTDNQNFIQDSPITSPVTFYSSPNFHTIHWGPKEQLKEPCCSEFESPSASQKEEATISNECNNSLNTPPNPHTDHGLNQTFEGSNCLYSDVAFKCLDMKSPPNVNIFAIHPVVDYSTEAPRSSSLYVTSPSPMHSIKQVRNESSVMSTKINSNKINQTPVAPQFSTGTAAHSVHGTGVHTLKEKHHLDKPCLQAQDRIVSPEYCTSDAKLFSRESRDNKNCSNFNCEVVSSSGVKVQNVKTTFVKDNIKVCHQRVSHLKRKYQQSESPTSSSEEESFKALQTNGNAKRKLLSSCRSYRQYKHLKKKSSKSKKIKDFITPYNVDLTKIHAPYHTKTPNYNYNTTDILLPNQDGHITVADESDQSVTLQGHAQLDFQKKRLIREASAPFNVESTPFVGTHGIFNVIGTQNRVLNSTASYQQMFAPHGVFLTPLQNNIPAAQQGKGCFPEPSLQQNREKYLVHTQVDQTHQSAFIKYSEIVPTRSEEMISSLFPPTGIVSGFGPCKIINSHLALSGTLPMQIQSVPSCGLLPNHIVPTIDPSGRASQSGFISNTVDINAKYTTEGDKINGKNGLGTVILPAVADFLIPSVSSEENLNVQSYSYPIKELRIGLFRYSPSENAQRNKIAVLQVKMNNCFLVYELELHQSKEDEQKKRWPFALIEIPFKGICNVRQVSGSALILEVETEPEMFMGYRQCDNTGKILQNRCATYKNKQLIDKTFGQLQLVPYHEIEMFSDCAQYIVNTLALHVEHIPPALRKEMVIEPQKQLEYSKTDSNCGNINAEQGTSNGVAQEELHVKPSYICQCTQGCQLHRCGCHFRMQPCTELCRCLRVLNNCSNPQSAHRKLGVSVENIMKDACLLANLPKVLDPKFTLKKTVKFPCCGHRDILQKCLLPKIACPGCSQTSLKYSWCYEFLFNEEDDPNFHCQKCRKCTEKDMYHCEICKRCHSPHDKCCSQNTESSGKKRNKPLIVQMNNNSSLTNIGVLPHNSEILYNEKQTSDRAVVCDEASSQILLPPRNTDQKAQINYKGLTVNLSKFGLTKHIVMASSCRAVRLNSNQSTSHKSSEDHSAETPERFMNAELALKANTQCGNRTSNDGKLNNSPLPLPMVTDESFGECAEKCSNIIENINKPDLNSVATADIAGLEFGHPLCTSSPIHRRISKQK